jgi:hypothetical protein
VIEMKRPVFIRALGIFFLFGFCMSFISAVSLIFPGSFLEPMWKLNPRGHESFQRIGGYAILILFPVSLACLFAGIGILRQRRWGYWLGIALLLTNLAGDVINVALGIEKRAIVGIPIALILVLVLLRQNVRKFFA